VHSRRNVPASLSTREVEVLSLVAQGLNNPQIAKRLGLSEKTVTNHLTRIFRKIGCPNRVAAVTFAIRHGIT
jgi:DNA-binding NarL/FixJ family response regulator